MKQTMRASAALVLTVCSSVSAVVLTFDDVTAPAGLTGTWYGGLTWEEGSPGFQGLAGRWELPNLGNHPYSLPNNVGNLNGSLLMGIGFPSPANMVGSYIAVQGAGGATSLRVHGFLQAQPTTTTDWFITISATPAWFDMSVLTNVDRIVFEATERFDNQAYYGIDDLTFTYTPEPTALGLSAAASFGLLLRRGRRR